MNSKIILFIIMFIPLLSFSQGGNENQYNDPQNMPVVVQQEAHYPGGDAALSRYINEHLVFPESVTKDMISGDLLLSFNVLPDSSLTDFNIITSTGFGDIDVQVVELMSKLKYAPSVQNGVKLRMNVLLSLPVRLKKY